MSRQTYLDARIQIKAFLAAISLTDDPMEIEALKRGIAKLKVINNSNESELTKKQLASRYGIDHRTFKKRMWESRCVGLLAEKFGNGKSAIDYWRLKRQFNPKEIDIIYDKLGTPSPII